MMLILISNNPMFEICVKDWTAMMELPRVHGEVKTRTRINLKSPYDDTRMQIIIDLQWDGFLTMLKQRAIQGWMDLRSYQK